MRLLIPLLFLCVCLQAQTDPFDPKSDGRLDGEFRVWTSSVGTVMRAKFKELRNEKASLQTPEGKIIEVDFSALSRADRDHIRTLSPTAASSSAATEAGSVPPAKDAPAATPPMPRTNPSSASAPATARARRIPSDDTIDKIPLLKRKSIQPVAFSFHDIVRGKTVSSNELKGKFVYVHTLYFRENMGDTLQQLKLLHAKYAAHGFEILSIHPYANRNDPSVNEPYEDRAVRQLIRRAIDDYGITWHVSYPQKPGANPLLSKFADKTYFDWLLDDQTRLIHANIQTSGTVYMSGDIINDRLSLQSALEMIFPGVN